ncbi:MAG: hypothetical protein GY778_28695 [bacterium]|nr:hypothetical protein [bacterium]
MSAKGVKIKELARELGVTSRAVIDRCRSGGFFVQNSITRVDPHLERQIRAWFTESGHSQPDAKGDHA